MKTHSTQASVIVHQEVEVARESKPVTPEDFHSNQLSLRNSNHMWFLTMICVMMHSCELHTSVICTTGFLLACSVALKLVAYQVGGGRGCPHYYDV